MQELSKSQKARYAIRTFKILVDSLTLQGSYKPSGRIGEKMSDALIQLSPEIYGSMGDPRIIELKGLEYVIDRMPRGIENCTKIILTAQEDFQDASFERIIPRSRRRVSYAVSDSEICFVITTGMSEIYDLLTHITFLNIEAQKVYQQLTFRGGDISEEWAELQRVVKNGHSLSGEMLEQAIWNLSIILGRTYKETKQTYEYLEESRSKSNLNNGLFNIVYGIGNRVLREQRGAASELTIYFTPSLQEVITHQKYAQLWARSLKEKLHYLQLQDRPIHLISANMHSVKNLIYGNGALKKAGEEVPDDPYDMVRELRRKNIDVDSFAGDYGYAFVKDVSGSNIDANIIDLSRVEVSSLHPSLQLSFDAIGKKRPVLIVIDYAFGTQAFGIMDEFLKPGRIVESRYSVPVESISVMGKAGVLPGKKGDIMIATAHVIEGSADNYIIKNDLVREDFAADIDIHVGTMLTVLGTSLQNRDVLERFHTSSWRAIGLEMEGGHYQRAISGAIIKGHIPRDMSVRYAYYASDNPMESGQTLASGPMGDEGIVPTYMISKVIIEKIVNFNGS
jgi:hypothetical protein